MRERIFNDLVSRFRFASKSLFGDSFILYPDVVKSYGREIIWNRELFNKENNELELGVYSQNRNQYRIQL